MQIIVLGMHRSGTSIVARLLNMMGCYFAPERMELPATQDNPKGYWERRDIVNLNEEILTHLDLKWDCISQYKPDLFNDELNDKFASRAKEIILGLDAHRPWMLKDPRLCLLLPFWLPLCELPVCVYVYRDPIEVAMSLQQREGFNHNVGLALWEKYTLIALKDSQQLPRILVSFHELIANPIETINALYESLGQLDIQGIRLPTEKEINAFLDLSLYREKNTNKKTTHLLTCAQQELVQSFEQKKILSLKTLPVCSESSQNTLLDYEKNKQLKMQLEELTAQLEKLTLEIDDKNARLVDYHHLVTARNEEIIKLNTEVASQKDELTRYLNELSSTKTMLQHVENQITQLSTQASQSNVQQQEVVTLRQQKIELQEKLADLQRANHFAYETINALNTDINAIFNSLTWRMGDKITQLALRVMLKQPNKTAKDHIELILDNFQNNSSRIIAGQGAQQTKSNSSPSTLTSLTNKVERHLVKNYSNWIKNYDTLTVKMVNRMQKIMAEWEKKPLISIILPTYNTDERWLCKAIDSVIEQIYPHWELCIADDASTASHIKPLLEQYAAQDRRIKIVFRQENGHISAASNSALELATGEYVTFLDHDDMLPRHTLFWVVEDMQHYPDHKMWYSDEDKVNEKDERYDPYFKCDWNPDLFLSHNLVTHLAVYQADIIKAIGGLREGFEGAQDYDLVLRFIEKISPAEIRHIPRILYHWRAIQGSTATSADEKPYALLAAQKAIQEFLERKGIQGAEVMENPEIKGTIRVKYPLITPPPLVSLIIPTRNGLELLKRCVDSILNKTSYQAFEILIIDNESDDPATLDYFDALATQGLARIIEYPYPFNYADMNNMAVDHAQGELIGLLNNDLEVINEDWLTELVSHAIRPEVGIVGARLWYPNDTLQHGGVLLGIGGVAGHAHKGFPRGHVGYAGRAALIQNFSAVTGACMVMRKAVFRQVGGLNAEHLTVALNDVDLCLKIHCSNLRCVWTPFSELYHHESASRGYEDTPEKVARYEKERIYMKETWPQFLIADPAYSPNLTLDSEDFAYAWPPRVPFLN